MGNERQKSNDTKKARPVLVQVSMPACCRAQLKTIDDKIETGKLLAAFTMASPFVLLFGDLPKGKGTPARQAVSGAGKVYSFKKTDWDAWAKAVKSVTKIVRGRCRDIAGLHALKHRKQRALREFWEAMHYHFS